MTKTHDTWIQTPPIKLRRIDFYPGDWLGGTVGLSLAERGLYITACAMIYQAGGPIRKADLRLAAGGRSDSFGLHLLKLVDKGKLQIHDGLIDQIRCEREIARATQRIATEMTKRRKSVANPSVSSCSVLIETNDLPDPYARAEDYQANKEEIKNLRGESEVAALPSPTPTPDEIVEVEALCQQAITTLRGGVAKGIRDPVAYKAAITEAKFTNLVKKLNAWVGTGLDGEAQWAAWEVLAAAEKAGGRAAMTRHQRRNFNKIAVMYQATEPIGGEMEMAA